jgi:flagellar export protein FliJ
VTGRGLGNLGGLVRLRSVRERDSRIGLATALAEERDAAAKVAELERLLVSVPAPATTDLAAFRARQHRVELLGTALVEARSGQQAASQLAVVARDQWVSDRSRLAAVESLVARRAAALLAERRKREERELDAAAEELWRRRTTAEEAS